MMDLGEIYQQYLDMPYFKRVYIGKNCLQTIKGFIKSRVRNNDEIENKDGVVIVTLIGALRKFIGADGSFDQDEYEFLNDIFETNFDYDKMLDMLNSDFFKSYRTLNSLGLLLDDAPDEVRQAFVLLGLLICVADGTLTYDEQRMIEKMM